MAEKNKKDKAKFETAQPSRPIGPQPKPAAPDPYRNSSNWYGPSTPQRKPQAPTVPSVGMAGPARPNTGAPSIGMTGTVAPPSTALPEVKVNGQWDMGWTAPKRASEWKPADFSAAPAAGGLPMQDYLAGKANEVKGPMAWYNEQPGARYQDELAKDRRADSGELDLPLNPLDWAQNAFRFAAGAAEGVLGIAENMWKIPEGEGKRFSEKIPDLAVPDGPTVDVGIWSNNPVVDDAIDLASRAFDTTRILADAPKFGAAQAADAIDTMTIGGPLNSPIPSWKPFAAISEALREASAGNPDAQVSLGDIIVTAASYLDHRFSPANVNQFTDEDYQDGTADNYMKDQFATAIRLRDEFNAMPQEQKDVAILTFANVLSGPDSQQRTKDLLTDRATMVTQLREQAAAANAAGNTTAAAELMRSADDMERMSYADIVNSQQNPLYELMFGVLADPMDWLGGGLAKLGGITDAAKAAKKGENLFNMQGDIATFVAKTDPAGKLIPATAAEARQTFAIQNIVKAMEEAQPKIQRVLGSEYVRDAWSNLNPFAPTLANDVEHDVEWLYKGAQALMNGVTDRTDAMRILNDWIDTGGQKIISGIEGLVSPKLVEAAGDTGKTVWGPGVVGNAEIVKRYPVLKIAEPMLKQMASLAVEAGAEAQKAFHAGDFMADFRNAIRAAAKQFHGANIVENIPPGAAKAVVTPPPVPNGLSKVTFLNKDGRPLISYPMVSANKATATAGMAQKLIDGERIPLDMAKAAGAPANILRTLLSEQWLDLNPRNHVNQAVNGLAMLASVEGLGFKSNDAILTGVGRIVGDGAMPSVQTVDWQNVVNTGDVGQHWLRKIGLGKDPITNALASGSEWMKRRWQGGTGVPLGGDMSIPTGETSLRLNGYYTGFTRAFRQGMQNAVKNELKPLFTSLGASEETARIMGDIIQGNAVNGFGQVMSELRKYIDGIAVTPPLQALGVPAELIRTPEVADAINDIMRNEQGMQLAEREAALREIMDYAKGQAIRAPLESDEYIGLPFLTMEEQGAVMADNVDTLMEAVQRGHMPPEAKAAVQQYVEESTQIVKFGMEDVQDAIRTGVVPTEEIGKRVYALWTYLFEARGKIRQAVDDLSREAWTAAEKAGPDQIVKDAAWNASLQAKIAEMKGYNVQIQNIFKGFRDGTLSTTTDWWDLIKPSLGKDWERVSRLAVADVGDVGSIQYGRVINANRALLDDDMLDLASTVQWIAQYGTPDMTADTIDMLKFTWEQVDAVGQRTKLNLIAQQQRLGKAGAGQYGEIRNAAWREAFVSMRAWVRRYQRLMASNFVAELTPSRLTWEEGGWGQMQLIGPNGKNPGEWVVRDLKTNKWHISPDSSVNTKRTAEEIKAAGEQAIGGYTGIKTLDHRKYTTSKTIGAQAKIAAEEFPNKPAWTVPDEIVAEYRMAMQSHDQIVDGIMQNATEAMGELKAFPRTDTGPMPAMRPPTPQNVAVDTKSFMVDPAMVTARAATATVKEILSGSKWKNATRKIIPSTNSKAIWNDLIRWLRAETGDTISGFGSMPEDRMVKYYERLVNRMDQMGLNTVEEKTYLAEAQAAYQRSLASARVVSPTPQQVFQPKPVQAGVNPQQVLSGTTVGKADSVRLVEPLDNGLREIEYQWTLLPAEKLLPSHSPMTGNPDPLYPADLQPRQRDAGAYNQWVEQEAKKLDYQQLVNERFAADASVGAPLVGPEQKIDGLDMHIVENGNGRTQLLLRGMFDPAYVDQLRAYQEYLKANVAKFGIDPAAMETTNPMFLVRQRTTPLTNDLLKQYMQVGNESAAVSYTSSEKALALAQTLTPFMTGRYPKDVVQRIEAVLPTASASAFVDEIMKRAGVRVANEWFKDGKITQDGVSSLRAMLYARAFGKGALLSSFVDDVTPVGKNLQNAIDRVVPFLADLKTIHPDSTLPDDVSKAYFAIQANPGYTYDQYVAQADMFDQWTERQSRVLRTLTDGRNSDSASASASNRLKLIIDDEIKQAEGNRSLFPDEMLAPAAPVPNVGNAPAAKVENIVPTPAPAAKPVKLEQRTMADVPEDVEAPPASAVPTPTPERQVDPKSVATPQKKYGVGTNATALQDKVVRIDRKIFGDGGVSGGQGAWEEEEGLSSLVNRHIKGGTGKSTRAVIEYSLPDGQAEYRAFYRTSDMQSQKEFEDAIAKAQDDAWLYGFKNAQMDAGESAWVQSIRKADTDKVLANAEPSNVRLHMEYLELEARGVILPGIGEIKDRAFAKVTSAQVMDGFAALAGEKLKFAEGTSAAAQKRLEKFLRPIIDTAAAATGKTKTFDMNVPWFSPKAKSTPMPQSIADQEPFQGEFRPTEEYRQLESIVQAWEEVLATTMNPVALTGLIEAQGELDELRLRLTLAAMAERDEAGESASTFGKWFTDPDLRANSPVDGNDSVFGALKREWARLKTGYKKNQTPTVGDMGMHDMRTLSGVTDRLIEHMRSGRPWQIDGAMTPEIRNSLRAAIESHVKPVYDSLVGSADTSGQIISDAAMINFRDRRNIDVWLGQFFPYHFFYTRNARNWMKRSFTNPYWADMWFTHEKQRQQQIDSRNLPIRFQSLSPNPLYGWVPFQSPYIRSPLEAMSPFGMYYPNELVDLESLTDDNEKMIAQWQRWLPGMFPHWSFALDAYFDATSPREDGTKRTDNYNLGRFVPGYRQAGYALQAITRKPQVKGFLGSGDAYDPYRTARDSEFAATAGMVNPIIAQYAQQIATNEQRGAELLFGIPQPYQAQAMEEYERATSRSAQDRLTTLTSAFFTGVGQVPYREEEAKRRDRQSLYDFAGYDPQRNPLGSAAAKDTIRDENPWLAASWSKSAALPGQLESDQPAGKANESIIYGEINRLEKEQKDAVNTAIGQAVAENPNLTAKEINALKKEVATPFEETITTLYDMLKTITPAAPKPDNMGNPLPTLPDFTDPSKTLPQQPQVTGPYADIRNASKNERKGMSPAERQAMDTRSVIYDALYIDGRPVDGTNEEWDAYRALQQQTFLAGLQAKGIVLPEEEALAMWKDAQTWGYGENEKARRAELDAYYDTFVSGDPAIANPEAWAQAQTLFGPEAIAAWQNRPRKVGQEESAAYYDANPQAWAVNQWLRGRPVPFVEGQYPGYNYGKDWAEAEAQFGPDIWKRVYQWKASDADGRKALRQQYPEISAFLDYWYALMPDDGKGGTTFLRREYGGRSGGGGRRGYRQQQQSYPNIPNIRFENQALYGLPTYEDIGRNDWRPERFDDSWMRAGDRLRPKAREWYS